MSDTIAVDKAEALVTERIEELLSGYDPSVEPQEFWGRQYDLGLAWVQYPEGFGGLGVSPKYQGLVQRSIAAAGAPTWNREVNLLGIGMGAGVISAHGTDEQKRMWLRPMFTTEDMWCQLFSEPGAGSDLANLSAKAVRDGDEWIVNGQKVWTTLAHIAKWGMLPVRTDPDVPKHKGITYFIVDMEAEGVDVRPFYQITGEAEFNEVFFDDVRIPDAYRLDEVGAGWRVSMTTLMNERVAIGSRSLPRGSGSIKDALKAWKEYGHDDPALRDQLTRYWAEWEALRLTVERANQMRKAGVPGPEGSTGKLAWADLNKAITAFTVELMGWDGTLYPGGYVLHRPTEFEAEGTPQRNFLRARANSIEGGTSEIMRNILGERVLGLPGEPRVDKDLPWKEVPRG
ncbi:MAG TPA: acyl-CoA dehydrogenase family protein [Acidimicrobiia bacterium]|nr:acyl-CoA dehydrogenase family protein [Acidimicrobiia bacterium]